MFSIFSGSLAVEKSGPCAVCNKDPGCPIQTVHPQCLVQLVPPKMRPAFAKGDEEYYVFEPIDYEDSDEEVESLGSELSAQQANKNVPTTPKLQADTAAAAAVWCSSCRKFTLNVEPGYKKCNRCRQKEHDRRVFLKAQGKCSRCSSPIGKSDSRVLCQPCTERRRAKDKARQAGKWLKKQ